MDDEIDAVEDEQSGSVSTALSNRDRMMLQVGLGVAGCLATGLLLCVIVFQMATTGAVELKRVDNETADAEASLQILIDRQLKVLPRLKVMQGGIDRELSAAARKVRETEEITERLAAAEDFSQTINALLERLKKGHGSASTPAVVAMLETLHAGELRVANGQQSYEAELAERAALEQEYGPRLALFLGMAD